MEQSNGARRTRELREFGLIVGALFVAVFGLIPLIRRHPVHLWPWIVAAILWTFALAWPRGLTPVYRGWTRLGQALGWINTRIILTVLYVLVIVPIGAIMRIFGRDRMARRLDPACASYRVLSRNRAEKDMEKPF